VLVGGSATAVFDMANVRTAATARGTDFIERPPGKIVDGPRIAVSGICGFPNGLVKFGEENRVAPGASCQ
jgi:hypothetical protein